MNFAILGAVVIQWLITSINRLWGAIAGLLVTIGIGIWGMGVYAQEGQITFFGFDLTQGLFLLFIAAWIAYDIVIIVQAGNGKTTIRLAEETKLFRQPDFNAPVAAVKMPEDRLEVSTTNKRVGKLLWMVVFMPNNEKAYIPVSTPILRQWKTLAKETQIYAQPDKTSPVLETLPKGAVIQLAKSERFGDEIWVNASTAQTLAGFIPGNTPGQEVKE